MLEVIRRGLWLPEDLKWRLDNYNPRTELGRIVKDICQNILDPEQAAALLDAICRSVIFTSELYLSVKYNNGRVEDFGLIGNKVITTDGVEFMVDAWQNLVELESIKYHGIGTDSTGETVNDAALGAELTTQITPNNQRGTGTTTENASTIFETTASLVLNQTVTLREHGLHSDIDVGEGVLFDRTVFSALTLDNGDEPTFTYRATGTAGG